MQFLSGISTTQIFYQNFASNFKQIKGIYYHHWFSDNFWWEKTLICLHLFNIIIEICKQTIKNNMSYSVLPLFLQGGGAKIFSILAKKGGLAISKFLGEDWVKRREWIFSEGERAEDFLKVIFNWWSNIT